MTNKQLTDEELNKITGGAEVDTYYGYSVYDSHSLSFNGGWLTLTIRKIDDSKTSPFYVEQAKRYSSGANVTDYAWMTLSDIQYFWNKSSLN